MWQPSATIETLKRRAEILQQIRQFFSRRQVIEVETPLMCSTSVTDPFIESMSVQINGSSAPYYLQTSPEYAMKRLLAAGMGSIYQISKAFRQDEKGRFHNPEFTMLEWYRTNFNHHDLMDEMDDLLSAICHTSKSERITYETLFVDTLNLNPHEASLDELKECAKEHHLEIHSSIVEHDAWLNLLMTHLIEPNLGKNAPCFIYNFPTSQAALAKIIHNRAARFEVYYRGMELANGFYELTDASEQKIRFEHNNCHRKKMGLQPMPIDSYFLSALEAGLPDCSGVALGLDRLIMLALNHNSINDVMSFDIARV